MDKCNSIEHDFHKKPNMYPNLNENISNEQQLRLNKINEIKYYLLTEIREGELTSKNFSKYIASFEYFRKFSFHNKIAVLARSKLDSIEGKISKALVDNEISHEDIILFLMKKRNIDS